MQRTVLPDEQWARLYERLALSRSRIRKTALRVEAARAKAQECREGNERLRAEAARRRAALAEFRAGLRASRPPATAVAPVLPRYSPGERDPLDEVRRQLHEAYAARRDPAVRAELVESYDGFARSLALKFRHRESVDDLVQVARIGLLHAIDRFDPALGRPFPLFARITITGELKRHLRDRTWAVRVPRSLQEDYLEVMRAVDELTAEHSDSPSMEALAAHCDMSVERVLEVMELRVSQRALSLDGPAMAGSEEPILELGHDDMGFHRLEDRELLSRLLRRLPDRDRRILELRFIDELTQSEIAAEVGVSQMCVSRVLARSLGRLRLWARTAVS